MAYSADKKPLELTELTSLAAGDGFVVGDADDATEAAKYITKANLAADIVPAVATTVTTNANLTGDVTSVGNAATLDKTAISGQVDTVITASDTILFGDATDTNNLKKDTVQGILDLAGSGTPEGTAVLSTGEAGGTKFLREDGDGTCSWQAVPAAGLSNVVEDTTPELGGNLDANNSDILLGTATSDTSSIVLNDSALADEKWSGTTVKGTAGATLAIGDLCYLASTGKWLLFDGILDGTDTGYDKMVGICVDASTDTNPTEMLVDGLIASAAFPAFTVGSAVYASDTAGDLVVAQPSTTNFAIRIMGYATSATVLHFRPSNDYIVHV